MKKSAISVYNPSDPLERAVQNAFHNSADAWLPSYPCRLFARAISLLKMFDDWLENPKLIEHRIKYFFEPSMVSNRDLMVFVTFPLFVRDILENNEINAYLHRPITFMTRPLAHYLFREYPIQIVVDMDKLRAENPDAKPLEIGGLTIIEHFDVSINGCVHQMLAADDYAFELQQAAVQTGHSKVAATAISRGVFRPDEHERDIYPESRVYDKLDRTEGHVSKVDGGEMADVEILYDDGRRIAVPKLEFDARFVLV